MGKIVEINGWRFDWDNRHLMQDVIESARREGLVDIMEDGNYEKMGNQPYPNEAPSMDLKTRDTDFAAKMKEIFNRILAGKPVSVEEYNAVHQLMARSPHHEAADPTSRIYDAFCGTRAPLLGIDKTARRAAQTAQTYVEASSADVSRLFQALTGGHAPLRREDISLTEGSETQADEKAKADLFNALTH